MNSIQEWKHFFQSWNHHPVKYANISNSIPKWLLLRYFDYNDPETLLIENQKKKQPNNSLEHIC